MTRQREKKRCEKRQWHQDVLILSVASHFHHTAATSNCRVYKTCGLDLITTYVVDLKSCEPCLPRLNVATAEHMLKFALPYQYHCLWRMVVKNGKIPRDVCLRLKGQVGKNWRFSDETATSSGCFLDCGALSITFPLPSLPVGYGGFRTVKRTGSKTLALWIFYKRTLQWVGKPNDFFWVCEFTLLFIYLQVVY